jgi:hypothetical protein
MAAGAISFWSVLGLFLIGHDNNGVVFSLGSVPRWYFLWGPFRGYISLLDCLFVSQHRPYTYCIYSYMSLTCTLLVNLYIFTNNGRTMTMTNETRPLVRGGARNR